MARFFFSALVNRVSGKLGDVVYSFYRGTTFAKSAPISFKDPQTFRQLQIRANLSALSKLWQTLPPGTTDLWNSFAAKRKGAATGFNKFVSLNGNILNASHSDLAYRPGPPPTPGTPAHVRGVCVFAMSSTQTCISWNKPDTNILYVTGHFRLHRGFCNLHPSYGCCIADGYRPSFRFIETVRSDTGHMIFDHTWPSGSRLWFRFNSLDKFGRKSPFTHEIAYINT